MDHFLKFDELCMSTQAIGDEVAHDEQLVILLGSLSDEYDQIVKVIKNMRYIDLFQAKEMLRLEHEGIARKENSEIALKATRGLQKQEFSAKRNKEQDLRDVFHMRQVWTQETRLLEKSREEKEL